MARSDLLLTLVQAGSTGDLALFRKAVEALIAEERGKRHEVLADRLSQYLKTPSSDYQKGYLNGANGNGKPLDAGWIEKNPRRGIESLILSPLVLESCRELIEEHHRAALLRSHNLEPRNRVLLAGEPGNGKTSLAEGIAFELAVPLIIGRYEGLIGSYLGETANRLKRLFDYVRTRACVLFLDEFDTIGKERGDQQETGEIKRVVSSLLLQIDDLPSHVVVMTATNHPELLDRAVWRRFQLRMELPPPTPNQAEEFLRRAQDRTRLSFEMSNKTLAEKLADASFAELEEFVADVFRRHVLAGMESNIRKLVNQRVAHWQGRYRNST